MCKFILYVNFQSLSKGRFQISLQTFKINSTQLLFFGMNNDFRVFPFSFLTRQLLCVVEGSEGRIFPSFRLGLNKKGEKNSFHFWMLQTYYWNSFKYENPTQNLRRPYLESNKDIFLKAYLASIINVLNVHTSHRNDTAQSGCI